MNNHKYVLSDSIKVENVSALSQLKNINPKFAKHIYYKNRIVEAFAVSAYGGVDVLEQPMCGKCEQPGFNTEVKGLPVFRIVYDEENGDQFDEVSKKWYYEKFIVNCNCVKCGVTTKDTLTLKEYLLQELKLPIEDLQKLENIMYGGK